MAEEDFVTAVRSSQVVEAGLIKKHISLGGYVTPMETALDDLLAGMAKAERKAEEQGLPFLPKAIYVSNTNIIEGGEKDDPALPFHERRARPILIWRHLVEQHGIDPREIAVYCQLKFALKHLKPDSFVLFDGGESDFEEFRSGGYRHIIFNLTLQEGWDDPDCYFAYIDKEMGSRLQVTQVVGRVLRQPGAEHTPVPELNTAHFYIRTDEKSIFDQVLSDVRQQVASDRSEIDLSVYRHGAGAQTRMEVLPRQEQTLPVLVVNYDAAQKPICEIIERIHDYRGDESNTAGKGGRIRVLQTVGQSEEPREEWVEIESGIRVTAREVFRREIGRLCPKAEKLCHLVHPKFDARIEYNSRAADSLREAARQAARAYVLHAVCYQHDLFLRPVPSVWVDREDSTVFQHAVHERYSGLNQLEKAMALGIDQFKWPWLRNLAKGLFEIPLMDLGATRHFNPDFVVWGPDALYAIDTKGKHLIHEDAVRKLFHIESVPGTRPLYVRLVTEGEWNEEMKQTGPHGYTVWTLRHGKVQPIPCRDMHEAVEVCLRPHTFPFTT